MYPEEIVIPMKEELTENGQAGSSDGRCQHG